MTGRNFVTRMRRGIGGVEGARGKKKKRRGFGRIGRLWKLLRHGAPWFTIFHRNVTQGHSYPSGYCRVPSEPGAIFSSFDFSSFSSLVFHFSCHFFSLLFSDCQDTRGIGGCVFILTDLSLFEADNDCGLGNFIEKFSIVEEFLSESLRCWWFK